MKNELDFPGEVALVTGAGAGMGLATAQALAEAGAAVVADPFNFAVLNNSQQPGLNIPRDLAKPIEE